MKQSEKLEAAVEVTVARERLSAAGVVLMLAYLHRADSRRKKEMENPKAG